MSTQKASPMLRWRQLHWTARVVVLIVLVAILWWQMRFSWVFARAMYGWPMPYNYIRIPGASQWNPLTLLADVMIWLFLAGGVGYTLKRCRELRRGREYCMAALEFGIALLVTAAFAYCEWYVRFHVGCAIAPRRFAALEWFGGRLVIAVGLFTEPFHYLPLTRTMIIFAITGAVFAMIDLVRILASSCLTSAGAIHDIAPHFTRDPDKERQQNLKEDCSATRDQIIRDPLVVRISIWGLVAVLLWLMLTLLPPR